MPRFLAPALLAAVLIAPLASTSFALRADEPGNHAKDHNDDHHQWDAREDKAYRVWLKEKHRKYLEFRKLDDADQHAYWRWRDEHPHADR